MNFITIGEEVFNSEAIVNIYISKHVIASGTYDELIVRTNPYQKSKNVFSGTELSDERPVFNIGRSSQRLNSLFISEIGRQLNKGEYDLHMGKLHELLEKCKKAVNIADSI